MTYDADQPTRPSMITIVNTTAAESCFGIEIGSGDGVFVPASISIRTALKVGDLLRVKLIENPSETSRERTPFMCVHAERFDASAEADPTPEPIQMDAGIVTEQTSFEITEAGRKFANALLTGGSCWNSIDAFREMLGNDRATRDDSPFAYSAIGNEFRRMFNANECSKFVLYRTATQSKASAEWFTCFPDQCEPSDWSDDDV